MNISDLCNKIHLQPEIKSRVLAFSTDFDFTKVDKQLKGFRDYEKMSEALTELQAILGEDTDNVKILSCMLKASADVYDIYQVKGISDEIYSATMKCYPRFISETYQITGTLYFDRYWWTTRQAGCHLFRIGELEYEMKHIDDEIVIGIHIPSDVDFSPSAIDESLASAKRFFSEHYPELSNAEYHCHSWLLDQQLREMLTDSSNILSFQNRFEIFDEGEIGTDFIEWLYNTRTTDYDTLPENTSLQRNMKKHILSGGVIRNAYGKLKEKMDLRTTFNTDENNYDKARPDYPSELFEDIFDYANLCFDGNVLEIGIGTGQATLPFLQKGYNITAVELGDRLAEYCKQKFSAFDNFNVINYDFLKVDLPEKHFDLVFSATAFHWIPKDSGYAIIKSLLKSNGVLALFWNHPFVSNTNDKTNRASMAVYQKYRPNDMLPIQFDESKRQVMINELTHYGFIDIQSRIYRRTRTLTSEEYINLIKTYSDHNALPEQKRLAFEQDMKKAIDEAGGIINIYDTIDLYLARNK